MAKRYSSILETIGNTPVVRINRLAPAGVNLFVKVDFADVPADMTEEELKISRSTPGGQLKA